jgi:heme-degrading monooxygenase HmoA
MWAQLIKMRVKSGREGELEKVWEGLRATEQPGSGLVRSTSMHDQSDHLSVYTLVVFESEEAARARENDPRRQESLAEIRALMRDIFDGPPEFVDLIVDDDHNG